MDGERAEVHLRLIAEAELRRRMMPQRQLPRLGYRDRVVRVADALVAAGAVSRAIAEAIVGEFLLACAVRLRTGQDEPAGSDLRVRDMRMMMMSQESRLSPAVRQAPAMRAVPDRVVSVGQVIPVDAEDVVGDLHLLAFAQTAGGTRITTAARNRGRYDPVAPVLRPAPWAPFSRFTAVDDKGASYRLQFRGGAAEQWTGELWLDPDPPPDVRWLDLTPAPGSPATRIDLNPGAQPPPVTVTATTSSPGERLLNGVALRMLAWAAECLPDVRSPLGTRPDDAQLGGVVEGLGDVIGALQAAGALPQRSPVPGQLAALCATLDLDGHDITARPAHDLPEPWESVLEHRRLGRPDAAPARWRLSCADASILLPELDGARIAILGLRTGGYGTVVNVEAGGVVDQYYGELSPLPPLWLRDSLGQWHATRDATRDHTMSSGLSVLQLAAAPPVSRAADWIEVLAVGRSAEVRAMLPLRWRNY